MAEHIISHLRVLCVLKETCRRRRHGLRVHLLAGFYNHDLLAK